jgi:predicted transcriptional regulator
MYEDEVETVRKIVTHDMLRLAVCSDLRRNLLINLNDGKKSLGDFRSCLNMSSTTAIHALRELEKNNLVFQEKDKKYGLTNIGRIAVLKLIDFSNAAQALKKNDRFWLEHDLNGIPDYLLDKIGWLSDSNIIQINPLDIIKTHNSYVNHIKNAKWIKGVSPIFSSDYPILFKKLVENDVRTQLILTNPVLNKLTDAMGLENLKNLVNNYHLELMVSEENLKVAFTVTDAFLSLGLFTQTGIYDTAYDMISSDDMGVRWGTELFDYYYQRSKRFEI